MHPTRGMAKFTSMISQLIFYFVALPGENQHCARRLRDVQPMLERVFAVNEPTSELGSAWTCIFIFSCVIGNLIASFIVFLCFVIYHFLNVDCNRIYLFDNSTMTTTFHRLTINLKRSDCKRKCARHLSRGVQEIECVPTEGKALTKGGMHS